MADVRHEGRRIGRLYVGMSLEAANADAARSRGAIALITLVAFLLIRLVGSTFVSTTGATPQLVLGVVAVLASVAFVATYLPARMASRIQPVRALSTE